MLQFAYILFKKIFFGRVTERDQQLLFDGLYSPQVAASARAELRSASQAGSRSRSTCTVLLCVSWAVSKELDRKGAAQTLTSAHLGCGARCCNTTLAPAGRTPFLNTLFRTAACSFKRKHSPQVLGKSRVLMGTTAADLCQTQGGILKGGISILKADLTSHSLMIYLHIDIEAGIIVHLLSVR